MRDLYRNIVTYVIVHGAVLQREHALKLVYVLDSQLQRFYFAHSLASETLINDRGYRRLSSVFTNVHELQQYKIHKYPNVHVIHVNTSYKRTHAGRK